MPRNTQVQLQNCRNQLGKSKEKGLWFMWLRVLTTLVLLLQCNFAFSQFKPVPTWQKNISTTSFTAKIIRILDGDTMGALYQNRPVKIRLSHIDAPEHKKKQAFGVQAKKALSNLCFGQTVTVHSEKLDRYGRLIAIVVNNKKQVVNQEMIKLGMAWHFKKYSKDNLYAQLEIQARKQQKGLWKLPNPVPPWEWRKKRTLLSANSLQGPVQTAQGNP